MEIEKNFGGTLENRISNKPKQFGYWTVIERMPNRKDGIRYKCRCVCGNEKIIHKSNLTSGRTKSCGCMKRELQRSKLLKTNEYSISSDRSYVIGRATNTGKEFFVDYEDWEKIKDISWHEISNGYMAHKDKGKKIVLMHRVVTNAPDGLDVDHINHNRKDNRKSNLRVCTRRENCLNRLVEPKGITQIQRGANTYFMVQVSGKYNGCFKNYDDAKHLRDELMEARYNAI